MIKTLRIDMSDRSYTYDSVPSDYEVLGGRGLSAKILLQGVEPGCHPLRHGNKLILAPGLLDGTAIPSSGRISIGSKSPLTGGAKESNGGGTTGSKLAGLGLKAVIIEGEPRAGTLHLVKLSKEGCEFFPADDYRGMGNYQLANVFRSRFGKKIGVASIGHAGGYLMNSAGIANLDGEGISSRFCGRGGLGAVMGAKGIKAPIIDDSGTRNLPSNDTAHLKNARKEYVATIKALPVIHAYTKYGTSGIVATANTLGFLPTCNFTWGRFEGAEKIDGEALYNLIRNRGGKGRTSHACMPGCIIGCTNVFPDPQGEPIVSPVEYETIGLFGANCCIDDLDTIAYLNYSCNDYGLDTVEVAVAMGIAMEAGVLPFGDREWALELVHEIGRGSVLGRVVGAGAVIAGKKLGVTRIPAVKGQSMAAYDPRNVMLKA